MNRKNVPELFIIGPDAMAAASPEEVTATVEGLKNAGLYRLPYDRVAIKFPVNFNIPALASMGGAHTIGQRDITYAVAQACVDTGRRSWDVNEQTVFKGEITLKVSLVDNDLDESLSDLLAKPLTKDPKAWADQLVVDYDIYIDCPFTSDELLKWTSTTSTMEARSKTLAMTKRAIMDLLIVMLATKNVTKHRKHHKLVKLGIGKGTYEYVTTISVPKAEELGDDPDHHVPGKPVRPHLRRGHLRHRQHYGPKNQFVRSVWIEPIFVNADVDFVSQRKAYNVSFTM